MQKFSLTTVSQIMYRGFRSSIIRLFSSPWRRRLASYLFAIYSFVVNIIPFVVLLFRIATQRPDLIHTHNAIESMLISIILKVPAVLHIHGPFGAESAFEIWLAKRAERCICVSRGLADMLTLSRRKSE